MFCEALDIQIAQQRPYARHQVLGVAHTEPGAPAHHEVGHLAERQRLQIPTVVFTQEQPRRPHVIADRARGQRPFIHQPSPVILDALLQRARQRRVTLITHDRSSPPGLDPGGEEHRSDGRDYADPVIRRRPTTTPNVARRGRRPHNPALGIVPERAARWGRWDSTSGTGALPARSSAWVGTPNDEGLPRFALTLA